MNTTKDLTPGNKPTNINKMETTRPSLADWQDKICYTKTGTTYKQYYDSVYKFDRRPYSMEEKLILNIQLEASKQFHDQEVKAMRQEIDNLKFNLEQERKLRASRLTSQSVQVSDEEIQQAIDRHEFRLDQKHGFKLGAEWMRTKLSTGAGSQWIQTEDKLPEENQIVIALNQYNIPTPCRYKKGGFFELDLIVTPMYDLWAPLPSPPKNQ